jgi:hypothetical protein
MVHLNYKEKINFLFMVIVVFILIFLTKNNPNMIYLDIKRIIQKKLMLIKERIKLY